MSASSQLSAALLPAALSSVGISSSSKKTPPPFISMSTSSWHSDLDFWGGFASKLNEKLHEVISFFPPPLGPMGSNEKVWKCCFHLHLHPELFNQPADVSKDCILRLEYLSVPSSFFFFFSSSDLKGLEVRMWTKCYTTELKTNSHEEWNEKPGGFKKKQAPSEERMRSQHPPFSDNRNHIRLYNAWKALDVCEHTPLETDA